MMERRQKKYKRIKFGWIKTEIYNHTIIIQKQYTDIFYIIEAHATHQKSGIKKKKKL